MPAKSLAEQKPVRDWGGGGNTEAGNKQAGSVSVSWLAVMLKRHRKEHQNYHVTSCSWATKQTSRAFKIKV